MKDQRTKGGKGGRNIPLHPSVRLILETLPRALHTDRVFLNQGPNGLQPIEDFRGAFQSAKDKAGIEDFVFHDFRHTAVTNLRRAGNAPTVIMKASGHKTLAMFLRYNLFDDEDLRVKRTSQSHDTVVRQVRNPKG